MNRRNKRAEQSPQLREYRRNRVFVASIVVVGVAVSIALNQLDASTVVNKLIASWPPLGLLLTLEALVRIPISAKWYTAWTRVGATIVVAGGAGWLSYWHMVAAVAQHGEAAISAHIFPATVDGLMTVTAVGMVELGARIRALRIAEQATTEAPVTVVPVPATPAAPAPVTPAPVSPVTVVPAPASPMVAAAEAMTAAALPVPVSPAPATHPASPVRVTTGSGPQPRRKALSPLTGKVLADRAPRV